MHRLANYFFRGLVLAAPVAITIYVCWVIFSTVDRWLGLPIPGAGFLATIALVTLLGFFASNLLTRGAVNILDRILNRLPFVRLLYSSTKDLLNAFVGEQPLQLRRVRRPGELHQGGAAVAFGDLRETEPVAIGVEPQRLGVDGDRAMVTGKVGQVVLVETDGRHRITLAAECQDFEPALGRDAEAITQDGWCPGKDSNLHGR